MTQTTIRTSFCITVFTLLALTGQAQTPLWQIFTQNFTSEVNYENPIYNVRSFSAVFTSPTGRILEVDGFWDGDRNWKVRMSPDETGRWTWETRCSDATNSGLHGKKGSFECTPNENNQSVYRHGPVMKEKGSYYLSHADGTPFFYMACTAWNGTLKSTDSEWEVYLTDRVKNHYNVIQFVTTPWRGGDRNSEGQVAFHGSGRIEINPAYFQHLDGKVDAINRKGLVAAPVLLWALPFGDGRELSPGYFLPDQEAVLLAKYLVARYGAHQVIWILGGDGQYNGEFEQRWKNIGRAVFGNKKGKPVALHSMGQSWVGKEFMHEDWLDIIGYQTGHNNRASTLNWITRGPVATEWGALPPKAFINMEPCYEEIEPEIGAYEVRQASYWSVLSTPVAGITYGANGIWPWIRPGEQILNHTPPEKLSPWDVSVKFPGSVQIGMLGKFFREYPWWSLKPAPGILIGQSEKPAEFISVSASDDHSLIMAYVPEKMTVRLRNPFNAKYSGRWFNPATGVYQPAGVKNSGGVIEVASGQEGDRVLVLSR